MNSLLDRVLDEFGLVICGWSGEWDDALRAAILRAPSRRFSTYWASRRSPVGRAAELVAHRQAAHIEIEGADQFFFALQENIEALQSYSRPHPVSKQIAVANLKRYLSEPRFRIHLNDLLLDEAEKVGAEISAAKFPISVGESENPDSDTFTLRTKSYEIAQETLNALASEGGFWGGAENIDTWIRVASLICRSPALNGGSYYNSWYGLSKYPTVLFVYSLGLGAVERGCLSLLGKILSERVEMSYEKTAPVGSLAAIGAMFEADEHGAKAFLKGRQNRSFGMNEHVHDLLRDNFRRILPNDAKYSMAFDKLEILLSLSYAYHRNDPNWYWAPRGSWVLRNENTTVVMAEINESLKLGDNSPYVQAGIFGRKSDECKANLNAFMKHLNLTIK